MNFKQLKSNFTNPTCLAVIAVIITSIIYSYYLIYRYYLKGYVRKWIFTFQCSTFADPKNKLLNFEHNKSLSWVGGRTVTIQRLWQSSYIPFCWFKFCKTSNTSWNSRNTESSWIGIISNSKGHKANKKLKTCIFVLFCTFEPPSANPEKNAGR